jgi:hypothetical protein
MVKKMTGIHYSGCALGLLGLILLAVSALAGDTEKAIHPELSEQEMLVACADCHQEATPEITREWYDSLHGIAMVKCYQCHGTFENFVVTPSRENCATCHADMLEKCPADKPCWECHLPHSFKEKK